MFKLIQKANYPIIKTFVNQYKYKVCTHSALAGYDNSEIFADNADYPTIVLVWFKPATVYIYGKITDLAEFNQAFKKVIDDIITPECLKSDANGLSISFFDEKYWNTFTDNVIEERFLHKSGRWVGIFDKDSYYKKELPKPLPENYKLCKITGEILSSDENAELKAEILEEGWNNIDDFLEKGIGFCVLNNTKVISSCYSVYISDNSHYEITVNTFDDNERKKGMATHCAIAFIDYCLENKYQPYWEADHQNIASHKLANKVGFTNSFVENKFIFLLDKATHYLWRIYNNLFNNEIDPDFIEFAIQKAFEDRNQKPNPRLIYAVANKLAENGIKNKVIFLLDEYLKIDKNTLQTIKENNCFKILHDSQEWAELVKKYEDE